MTKEEAIDRVQRDWDAQCEKLEEAGYSAGYPDIGLSGNARLNRDEEILLAQQYLIDEETGQEYLRELALVYYSSSAGSIDDVRDRIKEEVLESRDDRLGDLHLEARRTYTSNYACLEDLSKNRLLSEVPLYKWMGVSRAFPSRNRMNENEESSSGEIGTTPSLKTLWQMAGALGVHPILFLTDGHLINALVQLTDFSQIGDLENPDQVAEKAIRRIESAQERFDQAKNNGERLDASERWRHLIVEFAKEMGCESAGGKLGARLGTAYAIEEEEPKALIAMTCFGHLLGEVTPEWMISVDVFRDPSSDSVK
jgi:transcriptional regulator with XRE-family HTH domain